MTLVELCERWQADASTLRQWGAKDEAQVVERCARELAEALGTHDDEALTLAEAAAESGYSVSHLRRLITQNKLRDTAQVGPPLVRRGDLPRKPGGQQQKPYHILRTG